MGRTKVTDFYLYRWRYIIGFIVIVSALITLLAATLHVPGGVSDSEMRSTVISAQTPLDVILGRNAPRLEHAPYHILQHSSIKLFGVSPFSIKLPSLVLALASIALLYGLLRLWFRRNVAIITSLIIVTTGQFLLISQLGTPMIDYLFLNAALLFSASMIAQTKKFAPIWLIVAGIVSALSLYSPLEIYVVLSLAITCIIHPHARFLVFKQPIWALITSGVMFVGLLIPLIIGAISHPSLMPSLLGLHALAGSISWTQLIEQYIGFITPTYGEVLHPAYGLTIMLLALLGLYRLFSAKYTAKSYILTIWAIILVPIVLFNESAVTFALVPLVLLIAFAIDYLISSWYGLFPRNPYARVGGLLPLGVLIIGLTVSNIEHFFYGYHYSTSATSAFTQDVALLNKTLKEENSRKTTLLVAKDQLEFYKVFATYYRGQHLLVTADSSTKIGGAVIRSTLASSSLTQIPDQIITTDTSSHAARFYLYKNGIN